MQPRLQGVIPVCAFSARATRDDRPAFTGIGTERAFFGEFTEEAQEQSSFLIDRLIELTAGRSIET